MRKLGSSPLARRTRGILVHAGGGARLIPARAGNTSMRLLIAASPTAHPRSRGEHGLGVFGGAHYFISAHPRSRGEHVKAPKAFVKITGSSPLARGTLLCGVRRHASARLIPARAGNTPHARPRRYPSSAHPRSRGEHATATVHDLCLSGSSPLARGTHEPFPPSFFPPRLIPARAGNTQPTSRSCRSRPAHPRSRGEHSTVGSTISGFGGSSPLARGTHRTHERLGWLPRLIPARAGNTF